MTIVSENINTIMTLLNYLSYDELMAMPLPLVLGLAEAKKKAMKENPAMAGLGQLANLITGR